MSLIKKICLTLALALLAPGLSFSATGDKLNRSNFGPAAFSQEFNDPAGTKLSLWSPANPAGVWKSDYYFGYQRDRWNRPLTLLEGFTARHIDGERQVYIDQDYCGLSPFYIGNGFLNLQARRIADFKSAAPSILKNCAYNRADYRFVSGLVTTEKSYRATYGYYEARLALPRQDGTWPAWWLLPVENTGMAGNKGRLPEIDILEHYSGDVPGIIVNKTTGQRLNRTGMANITVHVPTPTGEKALTPPKQPVVSTPTAFHVYGVMWTPTELIFYIDDKEVWRTPFVYAKPMYMLFNLAISEAVAGDPDKSVYPATLLIDYVRAYTLPK